MNKQFTSLSFIIGLFFFSIALILICGYFIIALLSVAINLYAGFAFLLFGIFMIAITPNKNEPD